MGFLREIVECIFLTAGIREPKKCRDNGAIHLFGYFVSRKNQHNFPNRFTFLNKHLLLKEVRKNLSVETL